jgi:hypothetical protein
MLHSCMLLINWLSVEFFFFASTKTFSVCTCTCS